MLIPGATIADASSGDNEGRFPMRRCWRSALAYSAARSTATASSRIISAVERSGSRRTVAITRRLRRCWYRYRQQPTASSSSQIAFVIVGGSERAAVPDRRGHCHAGGQLRHAASTARVTDADGRFEIIGVLPGSRRIVAGADALMQDKTVVVIDRLTSVVIELTRARRCRDVSSRRRSPSSRSRSMETSHDQFNELSSVAMIRAESNADGRFALRNVPAGRFVIHALRSRVGRHARGHVVDL
jgi:hypothetical protein